jgi:uncharacterized protein (TIGR02594 family)
MTDPVWLTIARKYTGQKEVAGAKHNPLILRWWTAIRAPFTDDETPWCAAFVGGVLEEAGIRSTRSARARSYEKWGVPLRSPALGAICVFSRPGSKTAGHVGFYVGEDKNHYFILGGNQGDNVNVVKIAKSRFVTARFPPGYATKVKTVIMSDKSIVVSNNES